MKKIPSGPEVAIESWLRKKSDKHINVKNSAVSHGGLLKHKKQTATSANNLRSSRITIPILFTTSYRFSQMILKHFKVINIWQ